MGYYMRFISAAEDTPTLEELETWLKTKHDAWRLHRTSIDPHMRADIYLEEMLLGEVEINKRGDGLFDEEQEELLARVESSSQKMASDVMAFLRSAKSTVAVRVLWGGRATVEETLRPLDAPWEVLFEELGGLLQADDDGYYDHEGMVLEVG